MKKILSFSSSTLAISILNFISILILTRIFSPEDYGTANLLISYSIIFNTIITLATDQMIMHYYYKISLISIIKNFRNLSIVIILTTLLIALLLLPYDLYLDILLLILYSIGLLLNRIYMTIFRMSQSTRKYFIQGFGVKFFELLLVIFLALWFKSHYYYIVLPFIISVFIITILQYKSIHKIMKKKSNDLPNIDFSEQFNFSFPLMITLLVTSLTQNIDKIILNNFVTAGELGIYFSAFKIIGLVTILYTIVSLVWTPIIIKISDQYDYYLEIIKDSIKLFQYISLWVLLLLIIFNNQISVILGKDFQDAIPLVLLLIGMPLFMLISTPYSVVITISKRTKYHLLISIILLVLNTIMTLGLSYYFGIVGAAHSILLSYFSLYIFRAISVSKIHSKNLPVLQDALVSILILSFILMIYSLELLIIPSLGIAFCIVLIPLFYMKSFKRVLAFLINN